MNKENKYSINEISKKYKLSIRTLQYYDDEGVLTVGRLPNGYRYYTQKDLYTLDTIVILKNYGLELSEIKHYLYHASLNEQRDILVNAKQKKELELKNLALAIENINSRMNELSYLNNIKINKLSFITKNETFYEHLSIDDFKLKNEYLNTPIDNNYMVSVFSINGKLMSMAHPIRSTNKTKTYAYAYYEYNNNFNELLNRFINSLNAYDISNNQIYTYPILLEQNKYLHYFEIIINNN